jgi:membrane protein DedA with SNARE-associated domain
MPDLAALDDLPMLWVLTITALLRELGVPLPLTAAALLVGARAAAGAIDPLLAIAAIVGATLIGNAAWFSAGRRYGLGVLRLVGRQSHSDDFDPPHGGRSGRWDSWLLVIGRFVPGVALVAPPLAGARGMRWSKFLMLTAAGALLYGASIVGAGMLLHHEVESALAFLERFGAYTLAVVASGLAIYVAWEWRRRSRGDSAEHAASPAATAPIGVTCLQ